MSNQKQRNHSYVGRWPCGCVGYLSVVRPGDKDQANDIRDMLLDGWTIDRVDSEQIKEVLKEGTLFNCPHKEQPKQLGLDLNGVKN